MPFCPQRYTELFLRATEKLQKNAVVLFFTLCTSVALNADEMKINFFVFCYCLDLAKNLKLPIVYVVVFQ